MARARPGSPIGVDVETRGYPRVGSDIYQIGTSAGFNVVVRHAETDGWTRTNNPKLATAVPKSNIDQCEAVRRFMAHIQQRTGPGRVPFVVGHSVMGDINALWSAAIRCGVPYPSAIYFDDTHDQHAITNGSNSLASCYQRATGKPLKDNHDAEADARAARAIYDPARSVVLRLLSFAPAGAKDAAAKDPLSTTVVASVTR